MDISSKHQPKVEENRATRSKLRKEANDTKEDEVKKNAIFPVHSKDNVKEKSHAGAISDLSFLFHQLGRDISIHCLLQLSRSDYGSIAGLNKSFQSLIRKGELYQLRQKMGIIEHWIYLSCKLLQWEAFDPNRGRWMHLPKLISDECFMFSDKESLAVGTELLVYGKAQMGSIIYKYSLVTNMWSIGKNMSTPRWLFGCASLGKISIVAGGCDPCGNILSSVELYNLDAGKWMTLPNMNKGRKLCSAVFMDGKFYVLGGIADDQTSLTCGEEFDMTTKIWREIPKMFCMHNEEDGAIYAQLSFGSQPLIAVVKNVLYAADFTKHVVKKYVKDNNSWVTIGRFPYQAILSMNSLGIAFVACGDQLLFLGGPIFYDGCMLEINAWVPNEGAPQWNLLARKKLRGFVNNFTIMGC